MELTYANANLKLRTKNLTVVFDPRSRERADVAVFLAKAAVEVSPASRDSVFVIDSEGEYELGGVSFVIDKVANDKGDSLVATVRTDGVTVVVLTDLKSEISEKLTERLAEGDVLVSSLDVAEKAIANLAPSIAVLVGYQSKEEVEKYLESKKFEIVKKDQDKLKVDDNTLPENTEVVVLNV